MAESTTNELIFKINFSLKLYVFDTRNDIFLYLSNYYD